MINNFDDKPIIACSSGEGRNVAISLIRLSGFKDFGPIEPLLKGSIPLKNSKPRYSYRADIFDENQKIDEVVYTYYKAPSSYTGENLLEIGVHGNRINVDRIIELFCKNADARRAYGGEFTFRALKNKKLNISQVEGLDLLLNANNLFSLKEGFSLLKGELKDQYLALYDQYLYHRSALELGIDFLDDIGEEKADLELKESFKKLKTSIINLFKMTSNDIDISKPQIVLFGAPNAGKSSFFNLLLGMKRSIVSSEKGTTRDYVSESIKIHENYYEIVDTAGIRNSAGVIEQMGIETSLKLMKKSFFRLLLINPFEPADDLLFNIDLNDIDLMIFTHSDVEGFSQQKIKFLEKYKLSSSSMWDLSLLEHNNELDEIFQRLFSDIDHKMQAIAKDSPINLPRQRETIKIIYNSILEYEVILQNERDIAIISSELYILGQKIESLLGVVGAENVLKNIFTNFCIGK